MKPPASGLHEPERDEKDLLQYWRIIWRRKWLLLLVVGACTVAVVAASLFLLTPKYEASAQLLQRRMAFDKAFLGTDVFSDGSSQPDRDIQTSTELVKTPEVTAAVTRQLGDRLNGQPADSMVTTDVVNKVDIMEITATDADPQLAADVANAYAAEYIKWRQASDQEAITQAREPVEKQINSMPESLRATPGYQALVDKLNALKLAEAMQVGNLQIVKAATPPNSPISPNPLRNGLIALLASTILGVGLVTFSDRFDTKIRGVNEITSTIDKPVLASIPTEPKMNGSIVTMAHPGDTGAEAYRLLKTNLAYVSPDEKTKSILVTSPGPYEGKTTTIANLAVTLARGGKSVTILELDFRKPTLSKRFGLTGQTGITDVLAGIHTLDEAMQVVEARRLIVVNEGYNVGSQWKMQGQNRVSKEAKDIYCFASGPIPPNPGELAASDAVGSIIDAVSEFSDYILIDTPPLGVVGDAASLASHVDGLLLVVRMAKTDKRAFINTADILTRIPCNILGVVVTDVNAAGSYGYKGSYYKYGYS